MSICSTVTVSFKNFQSAPTIFVKDFPARSVMSPHAIRKTTQCSGTPVTVLLHLKIATHQF